MRRETLQLYRQFLKVLLKVEDKQYRGQLRVWIRSEFEVAGSQDDHDEVSGTHYNGVVTAYGNVVVWTKKFKNKFG